MSCELPLYKLCQRRTKSSLQYMRQMLRPATVHQVTVQGANNIRHGFLNPLFAPLVESKDSNLGTVLARLGEAVATLESYGR